MMRKVRRRPRESNARARSSNADVDVFGQATLHALKSVVMQQWFLLTLLLLLDAAFFVVHASHKVSGIPESEMFDLKRERSFAEWYQYIKEAAVIAYCAAEFQRSRTRIIMIWALLFLYFLVDDSLGVHETGGRVLVDWLGLMPLYGLRANDYGQLLVSTIVGLGFVTALVRTYRHADLHAKVFSRVMTILLGMLVAFGVVLDTVHIGLPYGQLYTPTIEDWGEMLVMSAMLAVARSMATSTRLRLTSG